MSEQQGAGARPASRPADEGGPDPDATQALPVGVRADARESARNGAGDGARDARPTPSRDSAAGASRDGAPRDAGSRNAEPGDGAGDKAGAKAGAKAGDGTATSVLPGGARPAPGARRSAPPRGASSRPPAAGSRAGARRRARLAVQRIDPWSVFLFSLVASIFLGIVLVVAVAALYAVLDGLGVLDSVNELVAEVTRDAGAGAAEPEPFLTASRFLGGAAVLAAVYVVLLTVLATLGALLYNLCSSFTGGVEVTLGERD